jgi:hypothetical protein
MAVRDELDPVALQETLGPLLEAALHAQAELERAADALDGRELRQFLIRWKHIQSDAPLTTPGRPGVDAAVEKLLHLHDALGRLAKAGWPQEGPDELMRCRAMAEALAEFFMDDALPSRSERTGVLAGMVGGRLCFIHALLLHIQTYVEALSRRDAHLDPIDPDPPKRLRRPGHLVWWVPPGPPWRA